MSEAVLGWQAVIFITILISGKYFGVVTAFWFFWTLVQIFAFWLSALQFFTVFISAAIASRLYVKSKAAAYTNPESKDRFDREKNTTFKSEQKNQEEDKVGILGHIFFWGLIAIFWAAIAIF